MQPQQLDNLKQLVRTSSILNEAERGEWLQLLELMNDKQLSELEHILRSSAPQTMPLKHIVNFSVPGAKPQPAAKDSSKEFSNHLKTVLAEKDLPSGQEPKQTETPVHHLLSLKAQPKPPKPAPEQPKPAAGFPEPISLDLQDIATGNLKVLNKQAPPPPAPAPKPKPAKPVQPVNEVRTGLERPEILVKAQVLEQQQAEEKKRAAAAQPAPKPSQPSPQPQAPAKSVVKVENVKDVAGLSLPVWRGADLEALAKKIKELVRTQGYDEIIVSLEKSPLYAAYISTGTEILQGKKNFEALGSKPASADQSSMVKVEFENFTDLLRVLQAA